MRAGLWILCCAALGLVIRAGGSQATGQEQRPARPEDPAVTAGAPRSFRELLDAAINQVEVFADADSKTPAKPLVAIRWANNARGSEDGLTLLYVAEGRPLAAACLYPWDRRLVHDFEALGRFEGRFESPGRGKIVARQGGQLVWQPQESGVAFAPIPQAPPPEATPTARLRQMKALAEEFQSSMLGWKADSTDREELRLLPRPLYRYELKDEAAAKDAVIDGAVFAFVMGTDPESLLLIEAVKRDGKSSWEFGFARRTSGELEGRHKGSVVWHADRYPQTKDPARPHFSLGAPIPPELLPGATQR